jgi:aminoglycoside 6'-N-acetyltransferase
MTVGDFPLICQWLDRPHMRPHYMDDGHNLTFEQVREKFAPRIDQDHAVRCLIAEESGKPFGYVQSYRNRSYREICELIGETNGVSIDFFIGEPSKIGRGLGRSMLTHFLDGYAKDLYPDEKLITVHHLTTNTAALKCSRAAGFVQVRSISKQGKAAVVLAQRLR